MNLNPLDRLYNFDNGIITNEVFETAFYGFSKKTIQKYKKELIESGKLIKIAPKVYILVKRGKIFNIPKLSTIIDKNSYISLFNGLNKGVIKQGYLNLFCCTSKKKNQEVNVDYLGSYKKIKYHYINIKQNFGIFTDEDGIRYADQERSFLDMIYLGIQGTIKIPTELNVNVLDKNKIKLYLEYYPQSVRNFLNTKLINYVKK